MVEVNAADDSDVDNGEVLSKDDGKFKTFNPVHRYILLQNAA